MEQNIKSKAKAELLATEAKDCIRRLHAFTEVPLETTLEFLEDISFYARDYCEMIKIDLENQ